VVQGRRRKQHVLAFVGAFSAALVVAAPALADPFVPAALREAAAARPTETFKVIVQGAPHVSSHGVAGDVQMQEHSHPGREHGLRRTFRSVSGVAAELTGRQVLALASSHRILAITPDVPLAANLAALPANVVPPAIVGTAQEGAALSALNGEWSGLTAPVAFAYQWLRCGTACSPIAGANAATYAPGADDVASTLVVAVTANDAIGLSVTARSAPSGVVQAAPAPQLVPPTNVSAPTVSGVARSGETLTAVEGGWSGVVPLTFAWQWQRCSALGDACADVAGATSSTYLVSGGDTGSTLRVVVSAQDAGGSASARSAVTAVVAADAVAVAAPLAVAAPPTISGDSTLTATAGAWSGGTAPLAFAWQWRRCDAGGANCIDIAGATSATYATVGDDAGSALVVTVTATDARGATASATSDPAVVATSTVPAVPPASMDAPSLSGRSPVEGGTIDASLGEWTGTQPIDLAYQWQRCDETGGNCSDVDGATNSTYDVTSADIGGTLRAELLATNVGGSTAAVSAASGRVAPHSESGFWNWQLWPYAAHADALWSEEAPPAIAVVDSGVDASLPGLAGAVTQQVTLTTLPQRAVADGYGHGSFVAQVAAGRAPGEAGAAPRAPIVSLDVMDDSGMALTSDVIAAADWIAANGAGAGIRVANFSLLGASPSSMQFDPLDRALEQLWLSGVVVVTAAGNYAVDGASSDAAYAPANDPFAITVGAADVAGTLASDDDFAAPWSAYGHTLDGFAKPELGAPGRYMTETVPTDATLYTERSDRIVAPGRLELSGTSFAAPVVSGVAADLLAAHPDWTPDQVKGALMLTAAHAGQAAPASLGVGEIDAAAAAQVADPPNPNEAIDAFVVPDPAGGPTPVFDVASWGTTVQADASWGTASWGTASWGTASWGTASWGTASWGTTYWSSASWGTASWGTASWGTTAAPADNAAADLRPGGAYRMTWPR
jgi:hypothetical protein